MKTLAMKLSVNDDIFKLSSKVISIVHYTVHSHRNLAYRISHRRRIELEDKAKVVASVWGTEFVQFLAALAVLPWSI